jgi:hypothetical protein
MVMAAKTTTTATARQQSTKSNDGVSNGNGRRGHAWR